MFLWGLKFTLHTDHKPLIKVLLPDGAGKGSARLARLAARLQEFRYSVEYIHGRQNVQVDSLSKLSQDWHDVDGPAILNKT